MIYDIKDIKDFKDKIITHTIGMDSEELSFLDLTFY